MAKFKIKKPTLPKMQLGKPRIQLGNLKTLVSKELQMYFNSPLAYIILVVSLFLHFLFFLILGNFLSLQLADISGYFTALPWIFIPLIPTLTMGSIASEDSEGTLEFILSKPVSTLEFILAKLTSVVIFILIMFLVELPFLIFLFAFGNFDYGLILSQFLASIFFATSIASFGIFISSIVKSQTGAFLLSLLGTILILLVGTEAITLRLPLLVAPYLERLSLLSHFLSMTKGAINLSDVIYFLGFIVFFTTLTYYKVLAKKLPTESTRLINLRFFTLLSLVIIFAVTTFGQRIPGRLDLTKNGTNSLTNATKNLVSNLPEPVKINVYYSSALPADYQPIKRDLFSILRDYKMAGGDNIEIHYKTTDDEGNRTEAMNNGIQVIQYQEGQSLQNFSTSQLFLGLVINYQDKSEPIPSVLNTNNLEYEISSSIKRQSVLEKKTIGFLDTKVKHKSSESVSALNMLLSNDYNVVPVEFTEENRTISNDITTLIIAGPNEPMSEDMQNEIRRYFNDGGSILLLADPVEVETQMTLTASKLEFSMSNFFEDLGIKVEPSLVYDVQSSLALSIPNYPLPVSYPLYPVVFSTGQHPTVNKIDNINLRWAGWISLDRDKAQNIDLVELFKTSNLASFQKEGEYNINLEDNFNTNPENQDSLLIALALNEKDETAGRAIVVSDSDFISNDVILTQQMDQIIQPNNVSFVLRSIEWLAQDESLAEIRTKERIAGPLVFPQIIWGDKNVTPLFILFIPVTIILGVISGGLLKFVRRKKEMKKIYE